MYIVKSTASVLRIIPAVTWYIPYHNNGMWLLLRDHRELEPGSVVVGLSWSQHTVGELFLQHHANMTISNINTCC